MTKLLLVEDDAIIANIYQRKLKMEGFDVTHAEDGEVAIDTIKEYIPDIVLLDLQLPKKNGVDVIQFIRGQESTLETPVVVFTNAYLGALVQSAWDAGATKCLTKAICTPKQVADVLRATLEGRDIGIGGRSQPPGGDPDGPAPVQIASPAPAAPAAPVAPIPAANDSAPIAPTGALADLLRSGSDPAPAPSTSAPAASIPMPDLGGLTESSPKPAAGSDSRVRSRRAPRVPRRPRMPATHTQTIAKADLAPAAAVPEVPSEEQFQMELKKSFVDSLLPALAYVRQKLQQFIKNENDPSSLRWAEDRSAILFDMYRKMHSVTAGAGAAGCSRIARVSAAFEALLTELSENTDKITDSTIRTVVSTVDFLGTLFEKVDAQGEAALTGVNIMVVDDEPLSRKAVMRGLEKADLTAKDVADSRVALELASEQAFSVIFLDIDMPGMDGYELCKQIRETSLNGKTPVVFVTGLNDFMAKAKSSLSGGNDLIAKPFLSTELAVKALSYLVKEVADKV